MLRLLRPVSFRQLAHFNAPPSLAQIWSGAAVNVSYFRVVRVLRAFKLARQFRRLRMLLRKVVASVESIVHVLLVVFFTLAVGGLLGMQVRLSSPRTGNDLSS